MNHHTDLSNGSSQDQRQQRFVRLYARHQRELYAYIGAFLPRACDTEEVVQETSVVLWKKFSQFHEKGGFLQWAVGVARLEIFRHLRENRRRALSLDAELIQQISDQRQDMTAELITRRQALEQCLTKLNEKDHRLIQQCYVQSGNFKQAAEQIGRPVNSVYKSLGRIRLALLDCIRRTLELGTA